MRGVELTSNTWEQVSKDLQGRFHSGCNEWKAATTEMTGLAMRLLI